MTIEGRSDEWRRAMECALGAGQIPAPVAQAVVARIEAEGAPSIASDTIGSWVGLPVETCERFLELARTLGAIAVLDRALSIDPGCAEALFVRGLARLGRNEPESATTDFERALSIAPANWNLRAEAVTWRDRARQAIGR